jgi:hypothetical protein
MPGKVGWMECSTSPVLLSSVLKQAFTAAEAKAKLRTLVAQKGPTRILSKGLVQRFSPRSHAGSLRLPSAVQTHG